MFSHKQAHPPPPLFGTNQDEELLLEQLMRETFSNPGGIDIDSITRLVEEAASAGFKAETIQHRCPLFE